jgi:hypothetical protein
MQGVVAGGSCQSVVVWLLMKLAITACGGLCEWFLFGGCDVTVVVGRDLFAVVVGCWWP